jgi:hypothetical protein
MAWLRTLKRKFGISAPRVAVYTHVAWYWRWLGIVTISAFFVAVGWQVYDMNAQFTPFRRTEADRALVQAAETAQHQHEELASLRSKLAQAERQLQIERATYGDLARQVKTLSEENAGIKEDLAFFQSLMPAGGREVAITINRFKLQPEATPGEYRYRLLLVQTGQRAKEFRGSLQFVLNLQQQDRAFVLTLPPEASSNARDYELNFRFFQRVEGTFKIAPGAAVKGLQVRVFENGTNAPKLTQTVSVS